MKSCRICLHPESDFIGKLLLAGISPRSISRRVGGADRVSLNRHRDNCLLEKIVEEQAKPEKKEQAR